MKKKISVALLSIISISLLAGCNSNESSTSNEETTNTTPSTDVTSDNNSSSTGGSVSEPIVVENYQRTGNLSFSLSSSMLGGDLFSFDAPISYAYQVDEQGLSEPAYSLTISPSETELEDGSPDVGAIEANYGVLATVTKLVGMIGGYNSVELSSNHFADLESELTADNLPDEELALEVFGNKLAYVNTSTSGDTTLLRSYAETDLPAVELPDLVTIIQAIGSIGDLASSDIISLLTMISSILPGEETIRPILSAVAEVVSILANGLAIDITTGPDEAGNNSADVSAYLNGAGLSEVNELLASASLPLSLNEFNLSFGLQDTEENKGLLTDVSLDIGITADASSFGIPLQLPLVISADMNLGTEITELDGDHFNNAKYALNEYRQLNAEVDDFYGPIRDYVSPHLSTILNLLNMMAPILPFDLGLDVSPADISLSKATGDMLNEKAESHASLSDEVKFMLGDYVTPETITANYDAGIEIVKKAVSSFNALSSKVIDDSNIDTIFSSVADYQDFETALTENEGADAVTALHTYLDSALEDANTALTAFKTAISVEDIDSDALVAAYEAFNSSDSNLPNSKYFTGDRATSLEAYESSKNTALSQASNLATTALNEAVNSASSFDDLKAIVDGSLFSTFFADGASSALTSDSVSKVSTLLNTKADELKVNLLNSFKAAASQEEWSTAYNAFNAGVSELKEGENTLLGSSSISDEIADFGSFLNSNISFETGAN